MGNIISVVMNANGMTRKEAISAIHEFQQGVLDGSLGPWDIESWLGIEPDYLEQILFI